MSYQRYLREKKEVQVEEELEEAARWKKELAKTGAGSLSTTAKDKLRSAAKSGFTDVKPRVTADPGGGFSRAQSVGVDKAAGERAKKLGDIRTNLGKQTTDTKPTTASSVPQDNPLAAKSKAPISPESIGGETLRDIVTSAGGDAAAYGAIKIAVKNAIAKAGIQLKNNSFLG